MCLQSAILEVKSAVNFVMDQVVRHFLTILHMILLVCSLKVPR